MNPPGKTRDRTFESRTWHSGGVEIYRAADDLGLLGLLHPGWRIVLGVCVAVAVVAAGWRLVQRGPSRMLNGMFAVMLLVAALVALTVLTG